MGYEEAWKVLADLVTNLREKDESVPDDIMEELRAAKTLINLLEVDPGNVDNLGKIETFMNNVESYLIFAAQKKSGNEYAECWMKKIEEARINIPEKTEAKSVKPVTGVPKGSKWVRVQISEETTEDFVKKLARENDLSIRTEGEGLILVYGENEKLRTFVAKMRQNVKERKNQ
jgi:hypothetical protein